MTSVIEREVGASAPAFPYSNLRLLSRTLDDIERTRIMLGNRIGAVLRSDPNAVEGVSTPEYITEVQQALTATEEMTVEGIEKMWARHPLAPWAKTVKGVGPKTIARLVAEIGDPLLRPVGHWEGEDDDRTWIIDAYVPRTLSQLRAFAGHGDPARRKHKGMTQDEAFGLGNPLVKKRLWLIASGGVKATCPTHRAAKKARSEDEADGWRPPPPGCTCAETHVLRHVYDEARIKYATRIEETGIRAGQPWRPARQKAAAEREVGKYFLRLLHEEASRLAQ